MSRVTELLRRICPPVTQPQLLSNAEKREAKRVGRSLASLPEAAANQKMSHFANVHGVPPMWRDRWLGTARTAWKNERRAQAAARAALSQPNAGGAP
jgi:hypothetical protein